MIKPSQEQIEAAFICVRNIANESPYGGFVSDDLCRQIATSAATAAINVPQPKELKK